MLNVVNSKILITGGTGFLGSHLYNKFLEKGVNRKNIKIPSSRANDLRLWKNCVEAVKGQDIIIHLAAKVGGIGLNQAIPGELFYDNVMMGAQLMEAARLAGVKKFVSIGTVCAYPNITSIPFKEEHLWEGYPEETNAPYGLAKKMLLVQGDAYRRQYGFDSIFLLPVNLYGPGDKFDDPIRSHVMPALIKKVVEAKINNARFIEVWGTGKATREFLYVDDAAEGIYLATKKYDGPAPINLGSGMEISIKELVELICKIVGYKGEVRWDKTKPDGQPRRCLDVSKAKKYFGFKAKTNFKKGVKETISWYLKSHELHI